MKILKKHRKKIKSILQRQRMLIDETINVYNYGDHNPIRRKRYVYDVER